MISTIRDWKAFNEAWRNRQAEKNLDRCLGALGWLGGASHRFVKEAEPWGILFAGVGLMLAVGAFWFDYADKVEERTVRAWQLVTTPAPGNSGKTEALEYLNSRVGFLCNGVECSFTLKEPTPLTGIDLSVNSAPGVYLVGADLDGADLREARLRGADLDGADLREARLRGIDLDGANLREADLRAADLRGADLWRVNLREADLREARLRGADLVDADLWRATLWRANLLGADLWRANLRDADLRGADLSFVDNLDQNQLDEACGDDSTLLFGELTIPLCADVSWFEAVHGHRDD